MQRFRSRYVIRRLASAPPSKFVPLESNHAAIIRVQQNLLDSLRQERDAEAVLERTRLLSEHLEVDRAILAEALFTARGRARRHQHLPFDSKTLELLD